MQVETAAAQIDRPSEKTGLKRQLGLRSATAMVVGEVIAVGIFLTPAQMAKSLGSPLWLLIVWLVMGGMALSGAFCYGYLASQFPEAGGGYVYLREAYGRRVAFLYGWMSMLVMDPGITAALAAGLASYIGYTIHLSSIALKFVAVGAILSLGLANIYRVRLGAAVLRWLTALKLGLILMIIILAFSLSRGDWSNFIPFVAQRPDSMPLLPALAGAMMAAFFSFGGWWDLSKLAGEVREPDRTLPRAMLFGVVIVTMVYILASAVFLYLVPLRNATSGETFAAQAGEALFGRVGGQVFAGIVIVSVLGSLAAVIMSAPRVYYAMAQDGVFVKGIASIDPRFGTPAKAIALQTILASLLVMLGTFNQIVAYFVFITVVFIALTVASVFLLKSRSGSKGRIIGFPLTPIFFLVLVSLLLVLLATSSPRQAFSGVAVVLLGLPIYELLFRKESTERKSSS